MDPLTDTEIVSLSGALEDLERELKSLHEGSAEGAAPVDLDEPIGRISRMDAIAQQRMVQANRESMQLRQRQVAAALRRIAQGEYGECVNCGEEVGFRRLEAQPETPLCIGCQSAHERRRSE